MSQYTLAHYIRRDPARPDEKAKKRVVYVSNDYLAKVHAANDYQDGGQALRCQGWAKTTRSRCTRALSSDRCGENLPEYNLQGSVLFCGETLLAFYCYQHKQQAPPHMSVYEDQKEVESSTHLLRQRRERAEQIREEQKERLALQKLQRLVKTEVKQEMDQEVSRQVKKQVQRQMQRHSTIQQTIQLKGEEAEDRKETIVCSQVSTSSASRPSASSPESTPTQKPIKTEKGTAPAFEKDSMGASTDKAPATPDLAKIMAELAACQAEMARLRAIVERQGITADAGSDAHGTEIAKSASGTSAAKRVKDEERADESDPIKDEKSALVNGPTYSRNRPSMTMNDQAEVKPKLEVGSSPGLPTESWTSGLWDRLKHSVCCGSDEWERI